MTAEYHDQAVYMAPEISADERRDLATAAMIVKQEVVQKTDVRESIKVLLMHYIEARKPRLVIPDFERPGAEVCRENDYLRGLLKGVDDAADYVTNPDRIASLVAAVKEKQES